MRWEGCHCGEGRVKVARRSGCGGGCEDAVETGFRGSE